MSLIKTAKEWIEGLQKLDPNTKLIGNLYDAKNLKEDIEEHLVYADDIGDMTDDEVIQRFQNEYDNSESHTYYEAIEEIAGGVDQAFCDDDDNEDDEEEEQED